MLTRMPGSVAVYRDVPTVPVERGSVPVPETSRLMH